MLSPGKLRKLRQLKVSLLCQEQQPKSQKNLKEENISKRQAVAELIVEKANSFVIGNMGETNLLFKLCNSCVDEAFHFPLTLTFANIIKE